MGLSPTDQTVVADKATFTASGIGSTRAWCTAIETGFRVVAGSSVTKNTTTMIPKHVVGASSWIMTVEFASVASWRTFTSWLDKYLDLARAGKATRMDVEVPDIGFARSGVLLNGGYSYGETFDQTKTSETLTFEGTGASNERYTKEPTVPLASQSFYPTTSDDAVETSLYDGAGIQRRIIARPATPAQPIVRDTDVSPFAAFFGGN